MTTIIAAIKDGNIHIAGDHRYTDPESGRYWDSSFTPKVSVRNHIAYGVAGDQPLVQHIIYEWEPPDNLVWDPMLAMQTQILPSLKEHIGDAEGEWEMIFAFNSALFIADKNGFTHDGQRAFAGIGSGAAYALGFLEAKPTLTPGDLSEAISVAASYNCNTSPAHDLYTIPNGKPVKRV